MGQREVIGACLAVRHECLVVCHAFYGLWHAVLYGTTPDKSTLRLGRSNLKTTSPSTICESCVYATITEECLVSEHLLSYMKTSTEASTFLRECGLSSVNLCKKVVYSTPSLPVYGVLPLFRLRSISQISSATRNSWQTLTMW